MRKLLACAVIPVGIALAGAASAATWPASVQGKWGGPANTSNMQYNITVQKPGGKCPVIYGVITDLTNATVSSLSGFYCPGSGRIVFMRKDNTTGRVFQVYRQFDSHRDVAGPCWRLLSGERQRWPVSPPACPPASASATTSASA